MKSNRIFIHDLSRLKRSCKACTRCGTFGIEEAIKGKFYSLSIKRRAVMESNILSEFKFDSLSLIEELPGFCKIGDKLTGLNVLSNQGGIHQIVIADDGWSSVNI